MTKSEFLHLADEAGFIFRGRVVRQGTLDARPTTVAEGKAVTVEIEEVLRSTDVLSGLAGRAVTVVCDSPPSIEAETSFVFFTDCLVLGDHLVVRDLGHLHASREILRDVTQALKMAEERPLQRRVAGADLIVTGRVIASRPAGAPSILRSEHDPEWWIARVEVLSVLKGGKVKGEIEVLFANSTDIAWYKAPKLHEGAEGIMLLRHVKAKEVSPEVARAMYQVTDPLDFLPADRLHEVRRALEQKEGDR